MAKELNMDQLIIAGRSFTSRLMVGTGNDLDQQPVGGSDPQHLAHVLRAAEGHHARQAEVEAVLQELAGEMNEIIEATGVPECVDAAMALCRAHGNYVFQGNYGAGPLSFRFLVPHGKRLTTFFPCDDGYGPCRRTVIKHMTQGILPWEKTVTHRIKAAEAPAMFERINKGDKDVVGVTIDWS